MLYTVKYQRNFIIQQNAFRWKNLEISIFISFKKKFKVRLKRNLFFFHKMNGKSCNSCCCEKHFSFLKNKKWDEKSQQMHVTFSN
jgi:hypothetical protein